MAVRVNQSGEIVKLASAQPDQVVRHARNGSHYRFERLERGRARIWPLELFPNGLLISKPTPTLIDADIEVVLIGDWADDMVVEGKPSASRRVYENELVRLEALLIEYEQAYEALPPSGVGVQSRGSWANKVKCTRSRIEVLKRGLGFVDQSNAVQAQVEHAAVGWSIGQFAQIPSGRIAEITGFRAMGDQTYVTIRTRVNGGFIEASIPNEVLRPAHFSRLCTV